MARQQFPFYKSFDDVAEDLTDAQLAKYIRTLLDVQFLRIKVDDVKFQDKTLSIVWKSQKHSINKSINGFLDGQKRETIKAPYLGVYDESCIPNEGIHEGMQTPKAECKEEVQVKEEGKGKGEVQKSSGFKKPSVSNILSYIQEKNYNVNADTFFNFYESNGWKIGKNKMKSWKASLATWNSKNKDNPKQLTSFKQQDEAKAKEKSANINSLLNSGFDPFSQADWDKLSEYENMAMQEHLNGGAIDVQLER